MYYNHLKISIVFLLTIFILIENVNGQEYIPKKSLRSPVDFPIILAGTFGELRAGHFHSGIDIKTGGVTGKSIKSVDDGYISRIKNSPWGYGKSIYVTHPGGIVSVYAHLESFNNLLADYEWKIQNEIHSFSYDTIIPDSLFPVISGDIIAYSGNSGSSGGPHLHFEIRDEITEDAINPLFFGFNVSDKTKPKIERLFVYLYGDRSSEYPPLEYIIIEAEGSTGTKKLIDTFNVWGNVGFGLHTNDYLDGTSNVCGIYAMIETIDNDTTFIFLLDEINFSHSIDIEDHIDFAESQRTGKRIHKALMSEGNRLSNNKWNKNYGLFRFDDNEYHKVRIEVRDYSGNKSAIEFTVFADSTKKMPPPYRSDKDYIIQSDFLLDTLFSEVSIKKADVFNTIPFRFERTEDTLRSMHSFTIGYNTIPLRNAVSFSTIISDSYGIGTEKYLLVRTDNKKKSAAECQTKNDTLFAKIKYFGSYDIMIDTVAPVIKPTVQYKDSILLKKDAVLTFKITDNLSGIDSFEAYIDDKWSLLEYEPKKNLFTCNLKRYNLKEKQTHSFKLVVTDATKNSDTFEFVFKL